jgi:chromate transporter
VGDDHAEPARPVPSLGDVLRGWGRIGILGFGGPPTHIALLRDMCVDEQRWLDPREFEDAVATCNLLPGPSSTQLAIFCAWRVRARLGAVVGGVAFIVPGLVVILALAALFLEGSPPNVVLGAGAGAGGAVPLVALYAGASLVSSSWAQSSAHARWLTYAALGAVAAALLGPWLVLVLVGCGAVEVAARSHPWTGRAPLVAVAPVVAVVAATGAAAVPALAWVAFKVGALAYGGGFVIIPLMQADAVHRHHWMTDAQFLDGVALGQATPGPVVQTVAVVGYAAGGIAGGLLAAVIAFSPSFAFVLLGGPRFDAIRQRGDARAFLEGAGPAAIGAIIGVAVPLARALSDQWQYAVLAGAALPLFVLRRGVVLTIVLAATAGIIATRIGAPLP